jgi:hypothetical protein
MPMRRSTAATVTVAWGVALGVTFGCLLPYLLNDWHFHRPLPYWPLAQAAGGLLICVGLVPIVASFTGFVRADGTPVPVASPPRLVLSGFYRYVRNPIYAGFLAVLIGEVLLFASLGLVEYTVVRSTRTTGAPCGPGFRGSIHGPRPGRLGVAGPDSAERSPAEGGATWTGSNQSRPPRRGCA